MLEFKNIEKSKIKEYRAFYGGDEIGCEANFVSAYLWNSEYNIKAAVFDDTLIKAYFRTDGRLWGYCFPHGKNVSGAVEAIFEDARENDREPYLGYMSRKEREEFECLYPGKYIFEQSTATQDYIYLTENLAGLPGKKYHAKRNHISRFYRDFPESRVVPITTQNAGDALEVVRLWCEENGIDCKTHAEYAVIVEALDNLELFEMRGMILYADEKPVAMTLGSEISKACFDVNFEKALKDYNGSYAVINNEFAKTLTSYKYLNREEDLGLEGLKKSKLSYHPEIIYERFDGIPK